MAAGIWRSLLVTVLVAACSSLNDSQWVWCQANSDSVKSAAGTLGLNLADQGFEHCTATADFTSCINQDADYIRACRAINAQFGGPAAGSPTQLTQDEALFCDGPSPPHPLNAPYAAQWEFQHGVTFVSDALGGEPTWQLRGVSDDALRSDPDYARACSAAFGAAH